MTDSVRPAGDTSFDAAIRGLRKAINLYDPIRFRVWAELGLTTAQLRVMFLIRQDPGITAGEIACRISVTPPTISGIVDRLTRLEFVRREDDAIDRRLVRNFLTDAGEEACTRIARDGDVLTRRILAEMPEADLTALIAGLDAFIATSRMVAAADSQAPAPVLPR